MGLNWYTFITIQVWPALFNTYLLWCHLHSASLVLALFGFSGGLVPISNAIWWYSISNVGAYSLLVVKVANRWSYHTDNHVELVAYPFRINTTTHICTHNIHGLYLFVTSLHSSVILILIKARTPQLSCICTCVSLLGF